jgi:uncharacterized membrane protein
MTTRPAPRSIDDYLAQLRDCLVGDDPALIQDAVYDAEEYLRAELAANRDKSEADVLEIIASTYGAPDEVAAAYRDTEAKVKAALQSPRRIATVRNPGLLRRFFAVFGDTRAYLGLFFMLLALATGVVYFTIAVAGLSFSVGFAFLIIGIPFFLAFVALSRVLALVEGRIVETLTGERMPRRPVHPGAPLSFWQRIFAMLKDMRTWTTVAYFLLMLPLGVAYFSVAFVGLILGATFTVGTIVEALGQLGVLSPEFHIASDFETHLQPDWLGQMAATPQGLVFMFLLGILVLTLVLHAARGVARLHGKIAKAMLVAR